MRVFPPSKSAVADFDTLRLPKSGKPDFDGRVAAKVYPAAT
jgi:hypothetical protein